MRQPEHLKHDLSCPAGSHDLSVPPRSREATTTAHPHNSAAPRLPDEGDGAPRPRDGASPSRPDDAPAAPASPEAAAGPAIADIVRQLDRLLSDAIACLEGLSTSPDTGRRPASPSDVAERLPAPEPLQAMLGRQQALMEALACEIAQGRTGGLSGAQLAAIADDLEARTVQCRRLLAAHVEALERHLAATQRQATRSRGYRSP